MLKHNRKFSSLIRTGFQDPCNAPCELQASASFPSHIKGWRPPGLWRRYATRDALQKTF
jgi:hypothetical protein